MPRIRPHPTDASVRTPDDHARRPSGMPSIEIHVLLTPASPRHAVGLAGTARDTALAARVDALDIALDGERVCAATRLDHAACLVRDIVAAALALCEQRSARVIVPAYDTPWELCLTPGNGTLCVSLYRTGALPEVRVLDRAVAPGTLAREARAAMGSLAASAGEDFMMELGGLVDRLAAADAKSLRTPARGEATLIRWQSRSAPGAEAVRRERVITVSFQAVVPGPWVQPRTEPPQSDLHALLVRGRVGMTLRGRTVDLGQGFVTLQVERLVALCRPLMEAWAARRALHLRVNVGTLTLGLRLGADERLAVTATRTGEGTITIPSLDPGALIEPVLDGALALAAALVRCDRGLARNLRLRALRTEARALRRRLRDLHRADAKVNTDPSLYRAVPVTPIHASVGEMDLACATRLRYTERWHAEIEGIDLAGTLLCGTKLVVPGARELYAIDRLTGTSLWSLAVPRAATTLAGDGILRLSSRGEVELRTATEGEVTWSSRIATRVGAPALAYAITSPGLPRLVVLAEGERRLVALDLRTGEARWTYTARHSGAFRMRRVGKLLVIVSGESTVTAVDIASGDIVWRFSDRVPFATTPVIHRDTVVALAGEGSRGPVRLYALGAYTGALQWTGETDAPACCPPVATGETVAVPLSTRDGAALVGFDLATGTRRYTTHIGSLVHGGARPAATAFDDLYVVNLPTGRVVAVGAQDGDTRWVQTFRAPVADDVPRRLDPQLRAGALFVPQSSLAVLRPRDGAVLAEIDACDLVPDLVRVDEQCAVYVAEESGHLGCYELGARLRVVR